MTPEQKDEKPFDTLNNAKGKRVLVELKNGKILAGILVAFDPHINLVLVDAEERNAEGTIRKLGRVFIRGDTVLFVAPEE